nr:probable DNA-3-methyladenine glycosylase [Onthophagus taurus]
MSLKNKLYKTIKTSDKTINNNRKKLKTTSEINPTSLPREFYSVPCRELADSLLGKLLLRKIDNVILKGRIVEVEMYPGGEDKASSSYNERRTPTNEPMYMTPGTAFVYKTYGIYHCFNISALEEGGAILLRAVEPLEGIEEMQKYRSVRKKTPTKTQDLCKGPSNLCTSMCITKEICNKVDMAQSDVLWVETDDFSNDFEIVRTSRIGIDSAGIEWAGKPFRFYIKGNEYVSKRDLSKEKELDV